MPLEIKVCKRWLLLPFVTVALIACGKSQADKEAEAKEAAYREKYAKAKVLFDERCKTAGVVVKRTVKDVDGIELTKVRQPIPWGGKEYFDPMYPEAAMADEAAGLSYVWSFLQNEVRYSYAPNRRGTLTPPGTSSADQQIAPIRGYRFVEYTDPSSNRLIRCSASRKVASPQSVADLMTCDAIKQSGARPMHLTTRTS